MRFLKPTNFIHYQRCDIFVAKSLTDNTFDPYEIEYIWYAYRLFASPTYQLREFILVN